MKKHLFLCGPAGCGKTKLIREELGPALAVAGGYVTECARDEAGKVISGFDYDDFSVITESLTNASLVCKNDISILKNRSIALEITVKNAIVYACEFR